MDRFICSVREVIEGQPCTQSYEFIDQTKALRMSLKQNVTYIVGGGLIKDDKFLMIQEAKKSYRGLWYLPIGRLEIGESLESGAQREVLEESGIQFKPESLVSIEWSCINWMRFVFTGQPVGGKLKTKEQQDKESLQANYFTTEQALHHLPIRYKDAFAIMSNTRKWYDNVKFKKQAYLLPANCPHTTVAVRILLVAHSRRSDSINILAGLSPTMHLPMSLLKKENDDVLSVIRNAVKSANYHGSFDIKGVLSVEHSSGKAGVHDGVWLTLFATTTESSTKTSNWINVNNNQELKQKILKLIHDVSLVPLYTGYH